LKTAGGRKVTRGFESHPRRFAADHAWFLSLRYPQPFCVLRRYRPEPRKEASMSILWIILIVVLVLALLGFFGFR
jgi:hypothetical protein